MMMKPSFLVWHPETDNQHVWRRRIYHIDDPSALHRVGRQIYIAMMPSDGSDPRQFLEVLGGGLYRIGATPKPKHGFAGLLEFSPEPIDPVGRRTALRASTSQYESGELNTNAVA